MGELADYTLSQLIENTRRELILIDTAMQRMDEKVYGVCVDCGADIPLDRLEALPYAVRCEEDATRHEVEARGSHYVAPSL
jgi:DnaK suppressor protein